jgi:uncharacterized membrane protein required for colicin V production
MWVDGIIAIILIFTIVQGYRHGFVHTFIHTVGWILAVVLGFVWYPHVIGFLKEKTGFYDVVHGKIAERIAENAGSVADSAMTGIPEVIRGLLDKAVNSATSTIASSISDTLTGMIFNIIGFLAVALLIKMILLVLTTLFSKEKNSGFIGGIDGLFGLFAGALKGLIIVYILLALMVPIASLSGSSLLSGELKASVLGSYLYDNNLILMTVKSLL